MRRRPARIVPSLDDEVARRLDANENLRWRLRAEQAAQNLRTQNAELRAENDRMRREIEQFQPAPNVIGPGLGEALMGPDGQVYKVTDVKKIFKAPSGSPLTDEQYTHYVVMARELCKMVRSARIDASMTRRQFSDAHGLPGSQWVQRAEQMLSLTFDRAMALAPALGFDSWSDLVLELDSRAGGPSKPLRARIEGLELRLERSNWERYKAERKP